MILKKNSSIISIGIILISIVFVGVIHFYLTNLYSNKLEEVSNTLNLLNKNKEQYNKINSLAEVLGSSTEEIKKEISSTADIIDYSLSALINGGQFASLNKTIVFNIPNKEELQRLKNLRRIWNEYNTLFIQVSKNNFDSFSKNNIKSKFKTLNSKQNSVFKLYYNEYNKYKNTLFIINLILVIFYIFVSIALYFFIKQLFLTPIKFIEKSIHNISQDNSIEKKPHFIYYNKVFLNLIDLQKKVKDRYHFVNQLVKDNYNVSFKNYNKNDFLESSLIKLRNKLKENIKENAKRQKEEELRKWFTDGQAMFNDILRESSDSINYLAESSLKNIVKFLNAAQGGFFIISENEENNNKKYLELVSSFAYDRVKSINKKIPIDEGLVGMCALEKNTIWLNNVPDDYMEIESGLGDAPPKNVLIVPLKTEENILGVIEIASFNEFNKDEVLFIESIADDIASTLETTKITDKTSYLLEESQKKSAELALRDAEMSEKINELKDLQKQTSKSKTEMTSLILAVDKVLFKLEVSIQGKILYANRLLLKKIKLKSTELERKTVKDIINPKEISLVKEILKKTSKNETVQQNISFKTKEGQLIKTNAIFSPIKDETGKITKALILGENINSIEEIKQNNKTLSSEIEKQQLLLLSLNEENENKNKEKNQTIKEIKQKLLQSQKIEKSLKEKFESNKDKKYSDWVNSFKL